jgi:hypothetical protein
MLPVIFLIGPTTQILTLKASALSTTLDKRVDYALFPPAHGLGVRARDAERLLGGRGA